MGGRTTTLSLEGSAALTPVAHKRQHTRMRPAHTGSPSHESRGPSSFGTACATIISNRNEPPVKRQGAPSAPVRRRRGKRSAHEKTQAFLPRMACPARTGGRGGTAYRGRHAFGRHPIVPRGIQRAGNAGPNTHPSECGLSADVHLERRIRGHAHQRNAASQAARGQSGGIPVLAAASSRAARARRPSRYTEP